MYNHKAYCGTLGKSLTIIILRENGANKFVQCRVVYRGNEQTANYGTKSVFGAPKILFTKVMY